MIIKIINVSRKEKPLKNVVKKPSQFLTTEIDILVGISWILSLLRFSSYFSLFFPAKSTHCEIQAIINYNDLILSLQSC